MSCQAPQDAMTHAPAQQKQTSELVANEEPEEMLAGAAATLDIEHAVVVDDPRQWTRKRKVRLRASIPRYPALKIDLRGQTFVLVIVSAASMIAGLGGNIYNRKQRHIWTTSGAQSPIRICSPRDVM